MEEEEAGKTKEIGVKTERGEGFGGGKRKKEEGEGVRRGEREEEERQIEKRKEV